MSINYNDISIPLLTTREKKKKPKSDKKLKIYMLLNINKQFVIEFEGALSSIIKASDIFENLNDLLVLRMDHDDQVRYRNLGIVKGCKPLSPFKMHFDNAFLSTEVCGWIETLSIKEHIELIQYVLSKISMFYY